MTLIEGRVGALSSADGDERELALNRDLAVLTQRLGSTFLERSRRGNLAAAITAASGVTPGLSFNATPPLVLWNPVGSGKLLSVIEATLGYVSGTLGAGVMGYGITGAYQGAAPTGGTELTAQRLDSYTSSRPAGRCFSGSTLSVAPVFARNFASMGPALATTPQFPFLVRDLVDGLFLLREGGLLALQGASMGAGTSPLVTLGFVWEEVAP